MSPSLPAAAIRSRPHGPSLRVDDAAADKASVCSPASAGGGRWRRSWLHCWRQGRRHHWRYRLLLLLSLLFAACAARAQDLVIAWTEGNAEPYVIQKDGQPVAGIIKDIGDRLALELETTVDYRQTPRKRLDIEISAARVDVILIFNRQWTPTPEAIVWSEPLFTESDLLLYARQRPVRIESAADLKGKHIGAVLGYFYPTVDPLFEAGVATREDVRLLEQNLRKLRQGRIDALIESDILLDWRLANLPAGISSEEFAIAPFVVSSHQITAAIAPQSAIGAQRIKRALTALKASGFIDDMLQRYR